MFSIIQKTTRWLALACVSTSFIFSLDGSTFNNTDRDDAEEEYLVQERTVNDPFYPIDYSQYTLKSYDPFQYTVVLNDGSIWAIRPNDTYLVSSWYDEGNCYLNYDYQPSKIYLTPNSAYLYDGRYDFCMVNKDTGGYVYCNIVASAPFETLNTIHYIDSYTGYVEVMNGNGGIAQFTFSGSDCFNYLDWSPYQRIVIARTSRYGYSNYAYTLINLDTKNRAKCRLY